MDKKEQALARFWSKVKVRGPKQCWMWQAGKFTDGYGAFVMPDGKVKKASRALWLLTVGPIKKGLLVMHTCDEQACVNPAHLKLGTNADNSKDMAIKGRASQGDGHWTRTHRTNLVTGSAVKSSKLTDVQVREIRARYWAANGVRGTGARLAEEYGVTRQAVWQVVNFKQWNHVEVGR